MELNTVTLNDFVKLANVMFVDSLDGVSHAMTNSGLFQIEDIPEGTGEKREYSEINLEQYADNKDEGDQAERAKVQQGYTKTMTPVRRAKDIGITVEMRKRNKYRDVTTKLTNLGELVPNRMELDLSHRFSFATATSYTDKNGNSVDISTGDGLALASTAHTVKGSATTYRNRLANNPKASKGALEGMERLVKEETIDQFGAKVTANFDVIWSTDDPNTCNTIKEFLGAYADVASNNAGTFNVNRSKYRHVELPLAATDADGNTDTSKRYYWGIASTSPRVNTAFVGIWERPYLLSPEDLGKDSAENWDFGVRGSYGITILNGTWFKFSSGDGTA